MAFTVEASFEEFYGRINLTGDQRAVAIARRDDVVQTLTAKGFDVLAAVAMGSVPRFTALSRKADVDVLVVLHHGKHAYEQSPLQFMDAVRSALAEYRTNVRKNGQAITLYYERGPNVDIVPAVRVVDTDKNFLWYEIPDLGSGTWIPTDPSLHAKAVDDKSAECGPMFRKIIKFAKHWNSTHGDLLSGYHVEVLALRTAFGRFQDISWEMYQFFKQAQPLLATPLWHGLSQVDNYLKDEDRSAALARWERAADVASEAWYAGHLGNNRRAIEIWRRIFGGDFPAYG